MSNYLTQERLEDKRTSLSSSSFPKGTMIFKILKLYQKYYYIIDIKECIE